ncbi:hypothetical protein J3F84DRAFT_382098 [Trichoderma pleuroticola]
MEAFGLPECCSASQTAIQPHTHTLRPQGCTSPPTQTRPSHQSGLISTISLQHPSTEYSSPINLSWRAAIAPKTLMPPQPTIPFSRT